MADDKKPNAAKDFLVKHGEKLGLGVAAAALLSYLLLGVVMAKEDMTSHDLEVEGKRIDKEKGTPHKENTAPEVKFEGSWIGPWNTVATAKAGNDSGGQLLPYLVIRETEKPKEKIKAAQVPSIAFGTAAVDFDGVTLTWTVKEFTKPEMSKGAADNDYFKLQGFVIERDTNASGKWEKMADLDAKTLTYKDVNIDPKKKYTYRITSVPEPDTNVKREEKAKGMTITPPSAIQTQGIWKLSFLNPSKPAGAAKGMVMIKIEKYEKGKGTVFAQHIQYAGDKIGTWEEQTGSGDFVTKHRAFKDGKALVVDFDTGYSLTSVEPTKITLEIKKCKKKYDSGGNWVACDQIIEKRTFEPHEIVYKDDEGDKKILSPNPRDSRLGQDDLCENHGGPKKLDIKKADDLKPDQPKEDPKVAKARMREEEASKLYDAALKAEAAKNKKQALDDFQRLLKEYADTEFVSKNKKVEVEERIARMK
jgi:hypothetical protein